jgi:hypothetical protein
MVMRAKRYHVFRRIYPSGPTGPDQRQPDERSWGAPHERGAPQPTNATQAISRILSSYSHLSGPVITERAHAAYLERNGRAALFLLGLAPGGVYRADAVTRIAGGLLHHRFTLACAHRPKVRERNQRVRAIGGLLSVALSIGSPRLGVTQHQCPAESGLSSTIARRGCPPALRIQG